MKAQLVVSTVATGMIVLLGLFAIPTEADAQFYGEVRAGLNIPTGDLADDEFGEGADVGLSFGVNAGFFVTPAIAVYAGWERAGHGSDTESEQGFTAEWSMHSDLIKVGALYALPAGAFAPYVHGGLVFGQVTGDMSFRGNGMEFSESFSTDRALGFEVGGGLAFALTPMFQLTPGVRYTQYAIEEDGHSDGTASFITIDVGLRISP